MLPLENSSPSLEGILAKLVKLGVTSDIQQKIGAFGVSWGLFESHLEGVIWLLNEESVKGVRPSTDKSQISDWIIRLGSGHPSLSEEAKTVLVNASKAAEHLMHYRHALFHGMLVPLPGGAPMFMRNPLWNGEIRKRESGSASVGDNLLDMAIESAWSLVVLTATVRKVMRSETSMTFLENLNRSIDRARSMSAELHHLAVATDCEKY